MRSAPRLKTILDSNVGWYHDMTEFSQENGFGRWELSGLGLEQMSGVYILWNQAGNCDVHELEHMQAMYVGKAGRNTESRLARHQYDRRVSDSVLATYVSAWPCSNRIAKYLEQLFLDVYEFPLNKSENTGSGRLCHHVKPAEWN